MQSFQVAAFSTPQRSKSPLTALCASRRSMLETSFTAVLAGVALSQPVRAEGNEDLSMPSEEEQQKTEVRYINALPPDPLDSTLLQTSL